MPTSVFMAKKTKQQFVNYYSSEHGIKLSYPSDWTHVEDVPGGAVAFVAPGKTAKRHRNNLLVSVQDLSEEEITLEQYIEINMAVLKQTGKHLKIIKKAPLKIAHTSGHKITFSVAHEKSEVMTVQIYLMRNDIAYVLTFSCAKKEYKKLLESIDQIVGSFEVEGKSCFAG